MQHYVATHPMFIDLEVMNAETRLVFGDHSSQATPSNVARGLASLYKEIIGLDIFTDSHTRDTIHKEATTIMVVFPSPNEVMSILVQNLVNVGDRNAFKDLHRLLLDMALLGDL
ncbi:Exocyst complex component 5 [Morus notabilis]|uniref:Exocyst complex component 5 n=1 Tax=Morus notabilis TaxID=981085 RepID=W9RP55_9ROSA|nr:Exocyst complex component 5 [Morus notabilis]